MRQSRSTWCRMLVWGLAVAGLMSGSAACSSDDEDEGGSKCSEGCNKAAELCGLSSSDTSECVAQCNAATQEQIDAAYACMQSASSCADAEQCAP